MKKILIITSFILANLCLVKTVQAQFNFKRTANNTRDTVSSAINIPAKLDTSSKIIRVADTNVKPEKRIVAPLPGGFNAKTQTSLRNNYAFFSESNKPKAKEKRIPFFEPQALREEDALFSEFVWEEIDGREKLNRPFIYQAYDDNGDQRFFAILMRAIKKEDVLAFSAEDGDDRFTKPITSEQVSNMLVAEKADTSYDRNLDNTNILDTVISYNEIPSDSIYTFRLKEQWVFDKKTSRMYCRIIGVAPIAMKQNPITKNWEKTILFWLYYPELRPSLAKNQVYNPKNNSTRITWEELFESRYFNSYIVKSSMDNFNDKLLNTIYKDPLRRLQEGEKIRQRIFDYEQDRWVY